MRGAAAFLAMVLSCGPLGAQDIAQPFDRMVELQPDGLRWLVLRYLVPDLKARGFDAAAPDLDRLCLEQGVPGAAAEGVGHVLVVLMDRPVPRGQPDPEATQFIGAFAIEGGECLWE